MSTESEIGEVVARVRQRSLAVCDNCGGEGYTDMGRSACAECYGAGVMTPELTRRLSALAPQPFPGRRGEKAQALAEAAANRWDAFNDREGVYWLKEQILGFKTEDDTRTISWANWAVEQVQEALTDAERERDEWKALYEQRGPNAPDVLCECRIGECVRLCARCREMRS